jgi:hypothetical protein
MIGKESLQDHERVMHLRILWMGSWPSGECAVAPPDNPRKKPQFSKESNTSLLAIDGKRGLISK